MLSDLTARQLDDQLAMSIRTKNEALKQRVLAEYRRRGIRVPQKLYGWSRSTPKA